MGMISQDEIRRLQQYASGPDSYVLSLYVSIDQSDATNLNRGFETKIENVFRRMAESNGIEAGHRRAFDAECEKVLRFIRNYAPKGKVLALFSDSRNDFFWHRELQVKLPTEGRWSQRPWVRPLLEVLEEQDRYAVVLTDKQRARILTADAAGVEQQAEIFSDVPNKHVTTGTDHIWSQMQMERDHAQHVKWHVERVVGELTAIIDRLKISRLVIGGPVEATSTFIGELPKRLQQMVIGTISSPLDASHDRLVNEMKEIQQRAEQKDEVQMVEAMITAAMKGDRAVLGISDVLRAIQEARVYRMVIARDYRVEGKECDSCHVLAVEAGDTCSFCDGKMMPAPDLINRASHRVFDLSGKVQMVSGEAAQKLAGYHIGAVLRF
jgi:hypothetical protein